MRLAYTFIFAAVLLTTCNEKPHTSSVRYIWYDMEVTATAYNSVVNQTDADPFITAFGDSLSPGKKYIAVSRDLLNIGLVKDTPVKIEGLDSIYVVKDKMHRRWTKRIDIYMGNDVRKARQWGKKRVMISYGLKYIKPESK